jgi:hypothetical protein
MRMKGNTSRCFVGILFLLVGTVSCATVPELRVNYRLPPKSEALKSKRVFVGFEDARASKDLIGRGAKKEYKNFTGNITYSLARDDESGFRRGAYKVPSLFKDVFQRRLTYLGAEVVSNEEYSDVELRIVLKELLLDLVEEDLVKKKWTVAMSYEGRLIQNGEVLANQIISGQGERAKVVGKGDADKVMGEVFEDLVNRLDVPRLFQQAGLL